MNQPIKLLNCSAFFFVLTLLTGCLIPHTTERSEAVRGRVLDANTHAPIKGVEIRLNQSPHHSVYTDSNGYFQLKATRNFHWAYTDGGGWPDRKDNIMEICHTNYLSVWGTWDGNIGDILLKPKRVRTE